MAVVEADLDSVIADRLQVPDFDVLLLADGDALGFGMALHFR
jgi:hypothetical protein